MGDFEGVQGGAVVGADVGLCVVASGCRSESAAGHVGADGAAHGAFPPHASAGRYNGSSQ